MTKTRLLLPVLAVSAALTMLAGCGDDGASSTDPASVAPPQSPVFIEAKIRPTGELKANIEKIAGRVAGIDDLGALIVSYAENAANDSGEAIDFEKDVDPWLGESAGIYLTEFNGEDFQGGGFAVEVTDTGAAEEFIEKQLESDEGEATDESYEGFDYKLNEDEEALGVVGNFIVFGQDPAAFEAAVDAFSGESLADSETYKQVGSAEPESTLANVFVDIAGLIKSAGSQVDPQALQIFEAAGVELEKSSALISLVPGSDNIEVDVASKLSEGAEDAVSAEVNQGLLGSMPAGAVAAFGVGDLGEALGNLIDTIDENGIPGQIPPGRFKSTLKQAGLDLEKISSSLGDAAIFVRRPDSGDDRRRPGDRSEGSERSEKHDRQHREPVAGKRHPGGDRRRRQGRRLLGAQPRPRAAAARRRLQGRPDRDRIRPHADPRRARLRLRLDALEDEGLQRSAQLTRRHADLRLRRPVRRSCDWSKACSATATKRKNWKN